jgi:hypothetical protein
MPITGRVRLLAALSSGVLVIMLVVVAAVTASAATALLATYEVTDSWGTGYAVQYTVRNPGTSAVTGWRVEFDLPAGTTVRKYWTAALTVTNQHVVFANLSYNATVPAGGSQAFGFNTIGLGRPVNCLVNGSPCDGGAPSPSPTTSQTVSPSPSPSKSPSPSPSPSKSPSPSPSPSKSPAPSPSPSSPSPSPTVPSPSPTSPSPSPSPTGRTVEVASAAQLSSALAGARPGDTIHLADGSYNGAFYGLASGTATAPITLTGSRQAVLSNSGGACDPNVPAGGLVSYCGYGLHLNRASYWKLVGFSVANSAKGIVFDSASHNLVDGVQVSNINMEGIHLRTASSDNVVELSYIHDTGKTDPGYGEGLYFGSATSNWDKFGENGGTGPDRSDRNQALSNVFGPNVGGEHIDVKEGTVDGLISGNTFDGRGISGQHFADSWVDVKGSHYLLQDNVGSFVAGTGTLTDGYQTHQQVAGDGCGNVWRGNTSDLGGVGNYAINVTDQANCSGNLNVVYSSNTVTNAVKGLTNITVTSG